jgi:hypothetical protein
MTVLPERKHQYKNTTLSENNHINSLKTFNAQSLNSVIVENSGSLPNRFRKEHYSKQQPSAQQNA